MKLIFILQRQNKKSKVEDLRNKITDGNTKKKVFFWNNRNARRKQSGTSLFGGFKEWLDKGGA